MKKIWIIVILVLFSSSALWAGHGCPPPPQHQHHHHHHHCNDGLSTAAGIVGLVGLSVGVANAVSTPRQTTVVVPAAAPTVPTAPAPLPQQVVLPPTVIQTGGAAPKTVTIRPDGTRIENY